MAVTAAATASGRQLYQGMPTATGNTNTGYTAPSQSQNVTAPSATAYVKEINITANAACTAAVYLVPAAGTAGNATMIATKTFTVADTAVLSGLDTMMPAGSTLWVSTTVANAVTFTISGVEVQ